MNLKLLVHDPPGIDDNKQSWHAEPYTGAGSFRSTSCSRSGYFDGKSCYACSKIPLLPSFKKRALLRHKKIDSDGKTDTTKINNLFLTNHEMKEKLAHQSKIIQQKESEIFFQKCHLTRVVLRVRNTEEKLKNSVKGDTGTNTPMTLAMLLAPRL